MQEDSLNSVSTIRSITRSNLRDLRNKNKEIILCKKRLRLQEVSKYTHDISISEFQELLLTLKQKNVSLEVLKRIKKSCVTYDYIETFFRNEGALNSLIRILSGNNAQKQLEAAACLTNLACGSHKCSFKVAKTSGAYLVSFINGSSYFLQNQSAWAAANIASDCSDCFSYIKAQGILPALLKALKSPLPSVVESVVFALNACTRYDDPDVISLIQPSLLQNLLDLIKQEDFSTNTFLEAAFILSNCCFLSVEHSLDVFDVDDVQQIVSVLMKITQRKGVNILVATPLVRCLGFLSYNDKTCEVLSVHPGFNEIVQVIFAAEACMSLKKELIWVLSNIMGPVLNMNACMFPTFDVLKTILKADDSAILQVLYYLLCLTETFESVASQLKHHDIFLHIQCLLTKEQSDITQAAKVLLHILER